MSTSVQTSSDSIIVSVYRDDDRQVWPCTNGDAWNMNTLLGDSWNEVNLPEITSSLRRKAARLGLAIRIVKQPAATQPIIVA